MLFYTLQLTVGIVQTAYANGASTAYIRDVLKLQTQCAKTGVKHVVSTAVALASLSLCSISLPFCYCFSTGSLPLCVAFCC
jgi:hypothetical protein